MQKWNSKHLGEKSVSLLRGFFHISLKACGELFQVRGCGNLFLELWATHSKCPESEGIHDYKPKRVYLGIHLWLLVAEHTSSVNSWVSSFKRWRESDPWGCLWLMRQRVSRSLENAPLGFDVLPSVKGCLLSEWTTPPLLSSAWVRSFLYSAFFWLAFAGLALFAGN